MTPRRQKTFLTLQQRVDVIRKSECGISARKLAREYGVGKTQVQATLKRKADFLQEYAVNNQGDGRLRRCKTVFEDINRLTIEWVREALAQSVHVTGGVVKAKALEFAEDLNVTGFKASNGWLQSFQKRHHINFSMAYSERTDILKSTALSNCPVFPNITMNESLDIKPEPTDFVDDVKSTGVPTCPVISDMQTNENLNIKLEPTDFMDHMKPPSVPACPVISNMTMNENLNMKLEPTELMDHVECSNASTCPVITNLPVQDNVNIREKATGFVERAENLKKLIAKLKDVEGKYHQQYHILDNSCGHSYRQVFHRFLDPRLTAVEIDDPHIRTEHQICNFLKFCETLVSSEARVTSIKLTTVPDATDTHQEHQLRHIKNNLMQYGVILHIVYSGILQEREIRFNNGWIVKIGRGLDYFKPPQHKFSLGYYDMDLRPCFETTIDILPLRHTRHAAAD